MLCFGFLIEIKHTYCVLYVTKRLTNGNSCFLEQVKAPGNEEECREPQPWNSDVFAAIVFKSTSLYDKYLLIVGFF